MLTKQTPSAKAMLFALLMLTFVAVACSGPETKEANESAASSVAPDSNAVAEDTTLLDTGSVRPPVKSPNK
ncbi:hypothetical protein [Foetidibacter luteolus]|uniref:hypothetical protein n=1 Tax=Foetidibacter luteolus TaxID=2608880 RepID=UPI00129A7198|nr:hypothetical protein [Foetidibacter luteolus]